MIEVKWEMMETALVLEERLSRGNDAKVDRSHSAKKAIDHK